MTKYLGIDYGSKYIGLAVSDSDGKMAFPLKLLSVTGKTSVAIEKILVEIQDHHVDAIVIGLPKNMDNSEGPQAKLTRQFAEELAKHTDKPIHFHDERLSSFAAEKLLAGPDQKTTRSNRLRNSTKAKRPKRRIDPVAAQVILQGFLDIQS